MKVGLGIDILIMIKCEVLVSLFGIILCLFGLILIDCGVVIDIVQQMVVCFVWYECMWLGIMFEGMCKWVMYWKSGFLCIVWVVYVLILLVFIDYLSKSFMLGVLVYLGVDECDEDVMVCICVLFKGYCGKYYDVD